MLNAQVSQKNTCSLLAVLCGKSTDLNQKQNFVKEDGPRYPFPELVSSGRLEVQTLRNPTTDEFQQILESTRPNIIYLQGQQLPNDEEVGSLVWNGIHLSTAEAICGLFGSTLPDVVYLELPNGEKLAEALCHKGVPYVIYWKNAFSCYSACHFRQTLLSVIQSSCTHTWDAFQLAHASFTLYCVQNNDILPDNCQKASRNLGPVLLGDPPKDSVYPVEKVVNGEIEDDLELSGTQPAIQIHDDDVSLKFLVCGVPSTLDACLFGSLEDGLNALLKIEIRGSKLNTRVSAPPPPLHAGAFSRGVVTMRCDFSTCSSCHVSLLVSGSAQTCFDDQQLENNIKNKLLEKSQLVHALPICGESNRSLSVPRTSASIACGSTVYEVCMKVPAWASQEEFLRDVMQFLILRGHTRLVPQCGISEFPDAILNTKRLDLYNLYREVVSRGGFHVGNGINWKGQVFSKMRNHTVTNKMTGVGNTLKKHYEAYLLEYELAHDDVDGECCLLCHSCAAGDWVNCGICGEWAHFGCDRRKGLGAFKDYAKTDGLEYICPQCSITNFSRKPKKSANGYSQASNGL